MTELSLDKLAPDDRVITITHDGEELRLPIRGRLLISQQIKLLRWETEINLAYTVAPESGDSGASEYAKILETAYAGVMEIIRSRTPDCPDLQLDEDQLLAVMSFISGDDTSATPVTDQVAAAIAPAEGKPATPRTAEEVAASGDTPLASETASPARSSGSESSTSGGPNGGTGSPGQPSELTSRELTPV